MMVLAGKVQNGVVGIILVKKIDQMGSPFQRCCITDRLPSLAAVNKAFLSFSGTSVKY